MVLSEVHETTDDAHVLESVEAASATLPRHVHLPLSLCRTLLFIFYGDDYM
jgi:hypothetical protein